MARIKAFLSYSDEDRHLADKFKKEFARHDVDVFLAHNDIRTGDKWRNRLFQEIKEREFFIVLLSENYHHGNYTDHECGMAVAHGKTMIPICVNDACLYGLIEQYQSTRCSPETVTECVKKIVGGIIYPKTDTKTSGHIVEEQKDNRYAVCQDLWKMSDIKIHRINCTFVPVIPTATTTKWHFRSTLQEATDKARMLGEEHDMKYNDCKWCKPSHV